MTSTPFSSRTEAPWTPCPSCGKPLPVGPDLIDLYFAGRDALCPTCGGKVEPWSFFLGMIQGNFFHNHALMAVGAHTTLLVFELLPGSVYHLDLTAHGVPKDARLAYINYTPQGPGPFPVEIHGNEPLRRNSGTTRVIFPVELAPSSHPRGPTKVAAMVAWMPPGESSVAWKSLVAAFESYSQGDFPSMVIPANAAVEVELSTLLRRVLESTCGKERVSDFLKSAATYSYQLNILLPVFAKWFGMPGMPDALRGRLNELRGERNAIAHGGAPEHEIDEKRAGELLCSALFGFKYVRMLASPKVWGG